MRAFRFRAATVLDLRVRQEEEAGRQLAVAQAALERARGAQRDAEARLARATDDYEAALRGSAEGALLGWHRLWIARLRTDVDSTRVAVVDRAAGVERATRALQEAHRARRVMERLRVRAFARYTRDERRASTRELDELGTIRFTTRTRAEGSIDDRERGFDKRRVG